jgi:multiple sugar transport system substrate-binding protein
LEAGKKVNWDFALVPVFKGKRRAKEYGVLDVTVGLSSKSANLEAAWKARKYHYDNYDFLMAEGGPQPRSIKKANDPKYWTEAQKTYKGVYAVMKDIEQVVPFRVMPHTRLQVEGDNRDKVFINIILEQADMDKALPDLTKRYNAALDKAVSDGKFKPDELKPANYDYFTRTT